ncbi:MAG: putative rane protein [Rhodocyclaceae bacterium]|nr:putative rane protein [Rhodocyclaceae bacterium]
MTTTRLQWAASASLIALIFLCLSWELWLAPLRPGGSWLALKAVFLLAPLFGILRGKRYTYQWTSLFILLYVTEGLVRATSDRGLSQVLAMAETALSVTLFAAVVAYARITRPSKQKAA